MKSQDSLSERLKSAMTERLSSELLSHIHDNFTPLKSDVVRSLDLQNEYHNDISFKLSRTYIGLSQDMEVIKKHLKDDKIIQQRITTYLMSRISEEIPTSRDSSTAKRKGSTTTQKSSNCHTRKSGTSKKGGRTESTNLRQAGTNLDIEDKSILNSDEEGIAAKLSTKDREFNVDSQESLREV